MADIKDKVVTVESLSALHEHNKESYMTKANPTGTGSLSMNRKEGTSIGSYSAAVGYNSEASGMGSFASGSGTASSGVYTHTEGVRTIAKGYHTHAEGEGTVASGSNQHVQGKYNIEDTKYLHIVGNGTSDDNRSNAHTLDDDGNAWFAGDVYVSGASQDDATKLVKSANIASIEYGDTLPEAGTVGRIFFKKISE